MVALALKDVGAAYGRTTVLSKVGIDTLESGSVTAVIGPKRRRQVDAFQAHRQPDFGSRTGRTFRYGAR